MALIEIDGLPINGMVIFHGYVSHNQMVIASGSGKHMCTDDDAVLLLWDSLKQSRHQQNLHYVYTNN